MTKSNEFIIDTATRFMRHLGSIERLLNQNILHTPKPSNMELGELIHYILHLKLRKIEAEKTNDNEELAEIEAIFKELLGTPFFGIIFSKVNVIEEEDSYIYQINSAMLRTAFSSFADNKIDATYDETQYQNSLIVSLVIGLELLIADIFKDYIHNLDVTNQVIKDKPLTYDDLKNFDSVEDAKIYLLDQYIENLLRNSFEGWLIELEGKLKINLKHVNELKVEINLINETLQRRHLIIHNDGIVNDLYIKKVDSKLSAHLVKGEELDLDKNYISSRIKTFRKFGIILLFLYGSKKHKNNLNKLFDDFNGMLVSILDKECEGVRYVFNKFSEADIEYSSKLMSKINYFLSYKLVDDASINEEIERFDTNALSIEYRMAKSILIEHAESEKEALEFFRSIDDDHFISVIEWPLIRLLKKTPAINRYIKRRLNGIIKREMREDDEN